jgi:hypothetical protein
MATPTMAVSRFIPAATRDPYVSSSTTSAASTPTSSAAPPTAVGGTEACPVTSAVSPPSRAPCTAPISAARWV